MFRKLLSSRALRAAVGVGLMLAWPPLAGQHCRVHRSGRWRRRRRAARAAGDHDRGRLGSSGGRAGPGGTLMGGTVYRVPLTRTDLTVTSQGVTIKPGLSLAMGDPVKLAAGLKAALAQALGIPPASPSLASQPSVDLDTAGIDNAIGRTGTASGGVYNHGLDEHPRLFYLHDWATGDGVTLAKALRPALDATNLTPPATYGTRHRAAQARSGHRPDPDARTGGTGAPPGRAHLSRGDAPGVTVVAGLLRFLPRAREAQGAAVLAATAGRGTTRQAETSRGNATRVTLVLAAASARTTQHPGLKEGRAALSQAQEPGHRPVTRRRLLAPCFRHRLCPRLGRWPVRRVRAGPRIPASGCRPAAAPGRHPAAAGGNSRLDYASLDSRRGLLFIAHLGASQLIKVDVRAAGWCARSWPVPGPWCAGGPGRAVSTRRRPGQRVCGSMRIPAGPGPDATGATPRAGLQSGHATVWTTNESGGSRPHRRRHRRFAGTVRLGGEAGNVAYDPISGHARRRAIVNQLAVIDPATRWSPAGSRFRLRGRPWPGPGQPERLAFIACDINRLLTLDMATWQVTGDQPVGQGPDVLAYDAGARRLTWPRSPASSPSLTSAGAPWPSPAPRTWPTARTSWPWTRPPTAAITRSPTTAAAIPPCSRTPRALNGMRPGPAAAAVSPRGGPGPRAGPRPCRAGAGGRCARWRRPAGARRGSGRIRTAPTPRTPSTVARAASAAPRPGRQPAPRPAPARRTGRHPQGRPARHLHPARRAPAPPDRRGPPPRRPPARASEPATACDTWLWLDRRRRCASRGPRAGR